MNRTARLFLVSLALATASLATTAQARDLMLVSKSANDSYFIDLDQIQTKEGMTRRAAPLFRLLTERNSEGYDYTQVITGFDCAVPGKATLLKVIAYDSTGKELRSETADWSEESSGWLHSPEDTHFGQAWQAVCTEARSTIRPGDVNPVDLLRSIRTTRASTRP